MEKGIEHVEDLKEDLRWWQRLRYHYVDQASERDGAAAGFCCAATVGVEDLATEEHSCRQQGPWCRSI